MMGCARAERFPQHSQHSQTLQEWDSKNSLFLPSTFSSSSSTSSSSSYTYSPLLLLLLLFLLPSFSFLTSFVERVVGLN